MCIQCRPYFVLEIMSVHVVHCARLRAPVRPLRRPPAVGGCHAHAQGPLSGGRKPTQPLEAAETASSHGLVHNITSSISAASSPRPSHPPAAERCRAHEQGPSASGRKPSRPTGCAGMAYGWRLSSSSMVRLNANATNSLGVTP